MTPGLLSSGAARNNLIWLFGEDAEHADDDRGRMLTDPFAESEDSPDDDPADMELVEDLSEPDGEVSEWSDDAEFHAPDWDDTPGERDRRCRKYDGECGHESVRARAREANLAEQVQDELEEIVTVDEDTTAARGDVLDMRNVTRRLAGDTTVEDYYRRRESRPGDDIAVGLSLDMSGSMGSDELEAKAAVGAFLFGVQALGGDVVANTFTNTTDVHMITGPGEEFRWQHLDTVEPGGAEPTAAGAFQAAEMLRAVSADEHLLFVLTDGRPTVKSRQQADLDAAGALGEVAETVTNIREDGIDVFGVGFGSVREDNLAAMFGDDAYVHCALDALATELVDRYRDTVDTTQVIA